MQPIWPGSKQLWRSTRRSSSTCAIIEEARSPALAVAINQRIRSSDEWFDEPNELDRVESALRSVHDLDDPVEAAAMLAFRVTRAQGFTERNKRTALLLAKWTLDNNGRDGHQIIDPDDRELADLLVKAASGQDVEADIVRYFAEHA